MLFPFVLWFHGNTEAELKKSVAYKKSVYLADREKTHKTLDGSIVKTYRNLSVTLRPNAHEDTLENHP